MLIILFLVLILICGCSATDSRLLQVEEYIQDRPKEALTELLEMDRSRLSSKKDKGLYSLLLSMALDKNYIDIGADSLIQPAVAYYTHRGDRYHKFLTFYYLGRVYENASEYDSALESFVRAESYLDPGQSWDYSTRLFGRKARIYTRQLAIDKALTEAIKARDASARVSNPAFYVKSSLDVASLYSLSERYAEAQAELDSLGDWQRCNNIKPQSLFYSSLLRTALVLSPDNLDSLKLAYDRYKQQCALEHRKEDSLLAARVENALSNYSSALALLEKCAPSSAAPSFDNAEYYLCASDAYQGLGDYKSAMAAEKKYEEIVEAINLSVVNNDVRFLEERYKTEQEIRRERITKAGLAGLLVLFVIGSVVTLLNYAKSRRKYKQAIADAHAEYDFIKGMLNQSGGGSQDVDDLLLARLRALKPFLEGSGVGRKRINNKGLAKLVEDRKKLLESIGLMCSLTHPRFASVLARQGLTAQEIGVCALYITDYRPKELPDILGQRSIYQRNTEIREKLADLVKDTTLPVWLRNTYRQMESR